MAISPEEFKLIASFLHEHSGIVINSGKEYLVENRLMVLLAQNGCANFTQFHQKLKRDTGPLRTKVVGALTTNETLWFRDNSFFSALTDTIIPELVDRSRKQAKVRIWSAASSTGQEPYSVAMLLDHVGRRKMPNLDLNRFSILGTDISPSALQMAKQSRYSQLAISRGMRKDFLAKYFSKNGMAYEVKPEIRNLVTFKPFNLKDSFFPLGKFDLILCRNVLIYFSDDLKSEIYGKIRNALLPNGYLAIGASESPRGLTTAFKQVPVGASVLYRAA